MSLVLSDGTSGSNQLVSALSMRVVCPPSAGADAQQPHSARRAANVGGGGRGCGSRRERARGRGGRGNSEPTVTVTLDNGSVLRTGGEAQPKEARPAQQQQQKQQKQQKQKQKQKQKQTQQHRQQRQNPEPEQESGGGRGQSRGQSHGKGGGRDSGRDNTPQQKARDSAPQQKNHDSAPQQKEKGTAARPRLVKGGNTKSFKPSFTPPDMRVVIGPRGDKFGRPYGTHDVVMVPELFCDAGDMSVYESLLTEIRAAGQDSLWASWHGDSHMIADDKRMGSDLHIN